MQLNRAIWSHGLLLEHIFFLEILAWRFLLWGFSRDFAAADFSLGILGLGILVWGLKLYTKIRECANTGQSR